MQKCNRLQNYSNWSEAKKHFLWIWREICNSDAYCFYPHGGTSITLTPPVPQPTPHLSGRPEGRFLWMGDRILFLLSPPGSQRENDLSKCYLFHKFKTLLVMFFKTKVVKLGASSASSCFNIHKTKFGSYFATGAERRWIRRMLLIRPTSSPPWNIWFIHWEPCELEDKTFNL